MLIVASTVDVYRGMKGGKIMVFVVSWVLISVVLLTIGSLMQKDALFYIGLVMLLLTVTLDKIN